MVAPNAPTTGLLSTRTGEQQNSHPLRGQKQPLQPEEVVGALQVAQDNLVERIYEFEKATPAHQTLGELIIKDVLIVASIAFWPAMFYWLM
jgi:hypothetical protein